MNITVSIRSYGCIWVTYTTGQRQLLREFLDEATARAWGTVHLSQNASVSRWTPFLGHDVDAPC